MERALLPFLPLFLPSCRPPRCIVELGGPNYTKNTASPPSSTSPSTTRTRIPSPPPAPSTPSSLPSRPFPQPTSPSSAKSLFQELLVFESEELAVSLAKYTAELSEKFAQERGAFTVVLPDGDDGYSGPPRYVARPLRYGDSDRHPDRQPRRATMASDPKPRPSSRSSSFPVTNSGSMEKPARRSPAAGRGPPPGGSSPPPPRTGAAASAAGAPSIPLLPRHPSPRPDRELLPRRLLGAYSPLALRSPVLVLFSLFLAPLTAGWRTGGCVAMGHNPSH